MLDLLNTKKAAAISVTNGTGSVSRETDVAPHGLVAVPLSQIHDNPYQPRGFYDAEHILKLAASIKDLKAEVPATMGLQQAPLARLVMRERDGSVTVVARSGYGNGAAERTIQTDPKAAIELMFGHSRLRAFMLLSDGLRYALRHDHLGINFRSVAEVETRYAALLAPDSDYACLPVILGFALDHAMWQHAITENSQRKNITAIEEARSIQRAMDEFGLNTEEAGKPFGYERSTTANKVRLLNLPAEVQKAIAAGDLSERHGRELLRVAADPARVTKLATMAVTKGMPVRQLAESVKWEEKELKSAQRKAQELDKVRALLADGWQLTHETEPVPADRVTDLVHWKFSAFDTTDSGHVALLQHGKCSASQCPCFVVGYSEHRINSVFRLDPDNAPHVCLACTDANERHRKEKALGDLGLSEEQRKEQAAAAERKAQAVALNNEAHAVWQRWLKEQDKHTLWNNLAFWQLAMKGNNWSVATIIAQAPDTPTACTDLLKLLYQQTRAYNEELRENVHTVDAVKKLIKALEGKPCLP